jgi:hypothetical protein
MAVTVPEGVAGGTAVNVNHGVNGIRTPSGLIPNMEAVVPSGLCAGQVFEIQLPPMLLPELPA